MKERIVIFRLGSLGDTVAALPCFNLIASKFPDAEKIALTNIPVSSKAAPLETVLGHGHLIDRAIAYPLQLRNPLALLRLMQELHALKASKLFYLAAGLRGLPRIYRDVAFFSLCGFGEIVGAPLTPDLASNRIDAAGVEERECVRLTRTLEKFGQIDLDDPDSWDLHLTADEKRAAGEAKAPLDGKPIIAINMGGKAVEKDWGDDNWQSLFKACADFSDQFNLVFIGGREDFERGNLAARHWRGASLNLCGLLSPRECAAAVQGAALFVGHDSGPLHLSACMGVPCIGLFGDYNRPVKWHPYGQSNYVFHEMKGVRSIQFADVANMMRQKLRLSR